ncbi:MAG: DUF192 domain-containing protein [Nitrospira sp.]|nr:DUF192 domain-containing protein [Nitrospira sp.]
MQLTRRTVIYIFFSILLLLVVINFVRTMEQQMVILTLPKGQQIALDVADSPEERLLGLFFMKSLPEDRGMVFIFEDGEPLKLWTRGYRFPIDLLWLDREFQVVSYHEEISPCEKDPCPTYSPEDGRAPYAIAITAGQIRQQGLAKGDRLNLARVES